ncbi:MAG: hypothetical protein IPO85_20215 [Saprospiraceae bacterium]|uniref:Uncharacterized protein n=1 Tax=Candidatus Defluviibacterium haderslevense TaxID=2981993 RepID=A0A9D7SER3_9BACT|nr:hypothetical protein [Candidatus Defluviibacterium haderslevense]
MATGPNKALLLKYVLHDCTPEEIIFVESWIKNDADIKKQIDQLKLLYQTDKETNQAAYQEHAPTNSETDSKTFIGWFGIISVFILIFILLFLFYFLKR